MLRIKALQDTVEAQRRQIATWNEALQQKVKAQVDELDRLGRLKGFFSPQLAEAIVSAGADEVLKPHRREITVVYLDLRGFTQFTDSAEPEEVMNMLSQYHALAGELIMQYQGTIEHFAGDGIMILFNDPIPLRDATYEAVRMTLALRDRVATLRDEWAADTSSTSARVLPLATRRSVPWVLRGAAPTRVGNVANLVARLCAEAKGGQILVSQRVAGSVAEAVELDEMRLLNLRGFHRPVAACAVRRLAAAGS